MRVAVVGGDSRVVTMSWPKEHDMRFFQSSVNGGWGEIKKVKNLMAAGKVDVVVVLTRWIGHAEYGVIRKNANCKVVTWPRGAGELVRTLEAVVTGSGG